ncbi:MAG: APC family permease [Christensenella sp.]|uniref:APC family permease n=1 Tax=Christensenella sp. TaxID=1935934 RepID=UPI002B1EDC09|nr:APC family permease [Christensenella sp.]MEA5004773.1 APC family permease [Christensenella sp.]
MATKKLRLFDAILAAVCIVLTIDAVAPAAAIGNSQYFWWILLLIGFFVPYGLVNAELGTAYEDEGGLCDWVKRAFGVRTGSRAAFYYWINFPIWVTSTLVMFTQVFTAATGIPIPPLTALFVQLGITWLVVLLSNYRISESKWLVNIGALIKTGLILVLGVLGVYAAMTRGVANPATSFMDFLPSAAGLSFISIIIFNFIGFEVVTTYASDMQNAKKEIPRAIILSGILITAFYLFASFGIGVAIPTAELSKASGFIDSLRILLVSPNGIFLITCGMLFLFTLVTNMMSWSLGVNYVTQHAAQYGTLPKFLASKSKKQKMPLGANITNGVIITVMLVIAAVLEMNGSGTDVFWMFFALNVDLLLACYLFLFPSFWKLRKIDPDRPRPYRVKGGKVRIFITAAVPFVLLCMTLFFTFFPQTADGALSVNLPLVLGVAVAIAVGEIVAWHSVTKYRKKQAGQNTPQPVE